MAKRSYDNDYSASTDLYDLQDANNHYTPIPNEIVDHLCTANLGAHEGRVLVYLLRKTFGFHPKDQPRHLRKTRDRISLSQFEQGTGLNRRRVCEALDRLHKRHIVTVLAGRTTQPKTYGISFKISEWQLSYVARTDRKNYQRRKTVLAGQDSSSYVARTELVRVARTELSYTDAPTKETLKEKGKKGLKEDALRADSPSFLDSRIEDSDSDSASKVKKKSRSLAADYQDWRTVPGNDLPYQQWVVKYA